MKAIFAALIAVLLPSAALAQDCTWSQKRWTDQLPAVREYHCAKYNLRISFLRLNEGIAGNLSLGEPLPEVESVLGKFTLAKNSVLETAADLFKRFGHRQVYRTEDVEFAINVLADLDPGPKKWRSISLPRIANHPDDFRRIWTLSYPFDDFTFRLGNPIFPKRKTFTASPLHYRYVCAAGPECVRKWRYAKASELSVIAAETEREVRRKNKMLGLKENEKTAAEASPDESNWPVWDFRAHFSLFKHLSAKGWLSDFLEISETWEGCAEPEPGRGDTKSYLYYPRPLALDVVVIENTADTDLQIKDLLGATSGKDGLRHYTSLPPSKATRLQHQPFSIAARSKIIMPLRILFLAPHDEGATAERARTEANLQKQDYAEMRKSPQWRKFAGQPPKQRDQKIAVYGPDISFAGLLVPSVEGDPNDIAWNRVDLTTAASSHEKSAAEATPETEGPPEGADQSLTLHQPRDVQGSCPYVYSLNAKGEWVNRGKVIEDANGPENETTSIIPVDPKVRHYRLAEKEPEHAYIRHVKLILLLQDGQTVTLRPVAAAGLRSQVFQYVLPAYSYEDVVFDVPKAYEDIGIVESYLLVTGFYNRLTNPQTLVRSTTNKPAMSSWRK